MRYAKINEIDISNGKGIGISLFVQGCHFQCKNCFNPDTWDFKGGKEFTPEVYNQFMELLDKPYIKRISILGGEPLSDENVCSIERMLMKISQVFGKEKRIWVYTGYTYEQITNRSETYFDCVRKRVLLLTDILVDGQYVDGLKDSNLKFKGSSNQRIIDVKNTLMGKEVVLYDVN